MCPHPKLRPRHVLPWTRAAATSFIRHRRLRAGGTVTCSRPGIQGWGTTGKRRRKRHLFRRCSSPGTAAVLDCAERSRGGTGQGTNHVPRRSGHGSLRSGSKMLPYDAAVSLQPALKRRCRIKLVAAARVHGRTCVDWGFGWGHILRHRLCEAGHSFFLFRPRSKRSKSDHASNFFCSLRSNCLQKAADDRKINSSPMRFRVSIQGGSPFKKMASS